MAGIFCQPAAPRDLAYAAKRKNPEARIFAGFRPAPEMLHKNPVVVNRLIDEAVKYPAFARVVREKLSSTVSDAPLETPPEKPVLSAPPRPLPISAADKASAAKPDAETSAKEKLKELRGVARENVARIKELEALLIQAERERDTAKAEASAHQTARHEAEASTRRAEAETGREKTRS